MKALLALDILANVLVAVLTELSLRGLIESLVALGAIVFPLGVPLDDLSGHQGRFDRVRPGGRRKQHGSQQKQKDVASYAPHNESTINTYKRPQCGRPY
jgi:hypothetical protein